MALDRTAAALPGAPSAGGRGCRSTTMKTLYSRRAASRLSSPPRRPFVLGLAACGGKPAAPASSTPGVRAATKKWQCPMHPEIVRDAPGDCPICGMKLVPIEETAPRAAAGAGGLGPAWTRAGDAGRPQAEPSRAQDRRRRPGAVRDVDPHRRAASRPTSAGSTTSTRGTRASSST